MPFPKCHLYKEKRSRKIERSVLKNGWQDSHIGVEHDKYFGEWKNGRKNGYGCYITKTGVIYDGIFLDNFRFYHGILAQKVNERVYRLQYYGNWKNGYQSGIGRKYIGNNYYYGYFKFSKRDGFGLMWYEDGSFYGGNWHKDLRKGEGLLIEKNGNRFEGIYENDKKNGPGQLYFSDSGQYLDGIWKDDSCIGGVLADIPYRQTASAPTKFPIPKLELKSPEYTISTIGKESLAEIDAEKIKIRDSASRTVRVSHSFHAQKV